MTKKKYGCLFLSAVLLAGMLFSACQKDSNDPGKSTGTPSGSESDAATIEDLTSIPKDLKFEGRTFKFLTSPRSGSDYNEEWLDYDEDDVTEAVSAAVYKRNSLVQDRLDIEIEVEHAVNHWQSIVTLQDLHAVSEHVYDAAYASGAHIGASVTGGTMLDLNSLEYVDFGKTYWDQKCYEALSIGNKNFAMVGDISMSVLGHAHAVFFNKQMLKDNNIETDIYQLVRDKEWTFDRMYEMMKIGAKENGDGVQNEKDTYGLFNLNIANTFYSFGFTFTDKDENDYPVLFDLTSEHHTAYELMRTVALDKTIHFDCATMMSSGANTDGFNHIYDWTRGKMFTNDQIMFMYAAFDSTSLYRDMVSDYGLVPSPKLTEAQKEYNDGVDYYADFLCVPATTTDLKFTGAVLEYMASVSTDTVKDTYIEIVMKNKRNRDEDTKEMVDLISNSLHYEISDFYGFGLVDLVNGAFKRGNLQSRFDGYRSTYESTIANFVDKISKLD